MRGKYGVYGVYAGIYIALIAALFILGEAYVRFWNITVHAGPTGAEPSVFSGSPQVVFIAEEAGHPYWNVVLKGAADAAGDDLWLDVQGPNKASVSEHIRLIERAVASRVDGIITQALDDEFVPVINKAVDSGIPVITIDTDAPDSKRIGFVGTDNYTAGYRAGEYLQSLATGPLRIGIISGNSYGKHMHLRIQGFQDALKDRDDCEIVAVVSSQINKVEAVNQAFHMLSQHPQINVMFGVSALDGPGIATALETYFPDREVIVIAFDDMPETMELLRQNKIQAIIAQQSYLIGYRSVERMKQVLAGQRIPSLTYTESYIIDRERLKDDFRQMEAVRGRAP